ncbi:ABC transporter substrate-binding protein [Flaviramulus aquimarinus]|uniref:ABC transporter substrate-binding protein n=1 Tax=Flaviramulus aquimarinus TaxID=1170456 RepID=UPI0031EB68C5
MKKITFILIVLLVISCKNELGKQSKKPVKSTTLNLKYAKGFSIKDYGTYKVLEIKRPWPQSEKEYRFALLKDNSDVAFWDSKKNRFDNIIHLPIRKIVVTSTTHIPALELLNEAQTLIGFPGIDFISSKKVRQLIHKKKIRELGKNDGLNTEILLELNPDLVVGFGIDGNNRSLETIKKSGIPVVFNGDWVENSPLAKAEWIKFFGALFNKEKEADSIFNHIEKNYMDAKLLAQNVKTKPSILSGAMHSDIWYLPNGTSTEAQLLKDANVNYLWSDTKGSGSLKLNFESVLVKAKDADIWLNPSNYSSLESLKNANENHTIFKAFQNKNIYTFTNTTGATGGVLYYELGMTRPDMVLKDLIKICHPEVLKNYKPYFFKPLE